MFSPLPRAPPLRLARFFSSLSRWAHLPPHCLSQHSLDFTFFSSFHTSSRPPHPFSGPAQTIKWPTQGSPLRPLGVVYVSEELSRPEPNEKEGGARTVTWLPRPPGERAALLPQLDLAEEYKTKRSPEVPRLCRGNAAGRPTGAVG